MLCLASFCPDPDLPDQLIAQTSLPWWRVGPCFFFTVPESEWGESGHEFICCYLSIGHHASVNNFETLHISASYYTELLIILLNKTSVVKHNSENTVVVDLL